MREGAASQLPLPRAEDRLYCCLPVGREVSGSSGGVAGQKKNNSGCSSPRDDLTLPAGVRVV